MIQKTRNVCEEKSGISVKRSCIKYVRKKKNTGNVKRKLHLLSLGVRHHKRTQVVLMRQQKKEEKKGENNVWQETTHFKRPTYRELSSVFFLFVTKS